ncbi:MAG: HAMP domain-containing protein [Proteobacteria bacterium]|nr:HAMP domain-containing protein [Pseudomonadota bacterium]
MSAPLVELASAARDVARGDYGRRVRVRSRDEIGILEESFNKMSAEVARAQSALRDKIEQLNQEASERKLVEMEREKLIAELKATVSEIKRLRGIIPICATCKKIRDDQGSWRQMEAYIGEHSEAEFSHGICPDCRKKVEEELERDLSFLSKDGGTGNR